MVNWGQIQIYRGIFPELQMFSYQNVYAFIFFLYKENLQTDSQMSELRRNYKPSLYYMTTEIRTETLNLWPILLLWHAKRFLLQWIAYEIDARKALCYFHVFKYLVSWTENLATKTLMKPNGFAHQLWSNFSWKKKFKSHNRCFLF